MDELLVATETALLESHGFRSKPQMQRLRKYLLKHSYENNEQALQQKPIAINCLGRGEDFIPSQDPIVRIEAARLRKLLDAFYDEAPQLPPYQLSLPKGSYHIRLSRNEDKSLSSGLGLFLICQASAHASESELHLMLKIRRELAARIGKFHHVDLTVEHLPTHQITQKGSIHFLAEQQYDYILRVEVISDGRGDYLVSSVVIHRASQEILWSNSSAVSSFKCSDSLEVLYTNLVRSLVSDSFGILGLHWSKDKLHKGLDNLLDHESSWVQLISFVNKPSAELGKRYLNFLSQRLKQCPSDYVAYVGYLCLAFYDFNYKLGLFDTSLEQRREQLVVAVSEYPTYDALYILLGLYDFSLKKYDEALAYLEVGLNLNPHNSSWALAYGGALFFAGEKKRGVALLERMNKGFSETGATPVVYLLPQFVHLLQRGDKVKAFKLSMKLGLNSQQWKDVGILKKYPDIIAYCLKAISV